MRGPQNCRLGFTGDARPRFSGPGTPRLPTGTPRLYAGTPWGSGESSSQAPTTLVTRNLCLDPAARLAGGASDQGPGSSFHEARPASTLGPSKAPSPVTTTQQLSLQRKPNCKQVGVAACQGTLSTKHRLWPWGSRLPPLATPPGQTRAAQTSSPREPAEDGAQGQVPAQRAWGLELCMPGQGPGDWCSGSRTTATSRSPPPAAADACARGEPHRLARRRGSRRGLGRERPLQTTAQLCGKPDRACGGPGTSARMPRGACFGSTQHRMSNGNSPSRAPAADRGPRGKTGRGRTWPAPRSDAPGGHVGKRGEGGRGHPTIRRPRGRLHAPHLPGHRLLPATLPWPLLDERHYKDTERLSNSPHVTQHFPARASGQVPGLSLGLGGHGLLLAPV